MPSAIPRPPWMWNTEYLQNLYRSNQQYYDNLWNDFVAQNPQYANFGRQGNPELLPSGGSPNYQPPSQQNWPGGNVPTFDLNYTPGMPSQQEYGQSGGNPQGGWANTFWGQALINAGLNFVGGKLQDRATGKANRANQKAVQDRIRQALQELSPQQIQMLVRQFLPQIASVNNPLQQTALQGLATSQARQGLAGTPFASTAEAGLRGQMANATSTQAFERAMQLAGQRASAVTGAPFVTQQPNTGFADAFSNTANQIMLARALSQKQPQQGAPFVLNRGQTSQMLRDPYGAQQFEGTPYQWGFR